MNARLLRPERSALPSWATSRHGHGRYIICFQMSTVFICETQNSTATLIGIDKLNNTDKRMYKYPTACFRVHNCFLIIKFLLINLFINRRYGDFKRLSMHFTCWSIPIPDQVIFLLALRIRRMPSL